MPKIYTTLYVDKVANKPAKTHGSITISAGKRQSLRVPVAHSEGMINEVVVKQVPVGAGGGTAVAFDVEVMDSCIPYHNGNNSVPSYEDNYNAPAAIDPDFFRVVSRSAVATPGDASVFRSEGQGYPFQNADQASQTVNETALYVCVIPTAAGGITKWQIGITTSKAIA